MGARLQTAGAICPGRVGERGYLTVTVIFMPGAWMVQRIWYVPFRVSLRWKLPLVIVADLNFTGPRVTVTLWGALPRQSHRTVVPVRTVNLVGAKTLSLTATALVTVFVALMDGTAAAPAATIAIVPTAMNLFT
jgi:hypothetical protein